MTDSKSNPDGDRFNFLPADDIRWHHRHDSTSYLNVDSMRLHLTKSSPVNVCKRAFNTLERTKISQLRLERSAAGKYILVRCIEKGIPTAGWHTVVEDHVGKVCSLSVYNYPTQELFSPGTALLIKEPYLVTSAIQGDPRDSRSPRMYSICCVSITDILALTPSHHLFHLTKNVGWVNKLDRSANDPLTTMRPLPSTALQWKARGDSFLAQNPTLAREAYFLALKLCKNQDKNTTKLLNLSLLAVHMQLECYETAIELAEKILNKFPEEKAALSQLEKAYYALRKIEKAYHTYRRFGEKFGEDEEGSEEFRRLQQRIGERQGKFDMKELRRLAQQSPPQEIDCADYDGPTRIEYISGKGRGLVLTEDVGKDAVVLVSKALASFLHSKKEIKDVQTFETYKAKIFSKLVTMISKNPKRFGPLVFDLSWHSTLPNEPLQLFCDSPVNQEPVCDVNKIKGIYHVNSFQLMSNGNREGYGMGIFIRPSYLNHSCEPNVKCEFYGDVMVVRALVDIEAGTELTISYLIEENWNFQKRAAYFYKKGFKCKCDKCVKQI